MSEYSDKDLEKIATTTRSKEQILFAAQNGYSLRTIGELAFLLHIIDDLQTYDRRPKTCELICAKILCESEDKICKRLGIDPESPIKNKVIQYLDAQATSLFNMK